jgi:hypothetical protein
MIVNLCHNKVMATKLKGRGRPPLLAPCPWCLKKLSARERRAHEPHCKKRPR